MLSSKGSDCSDADIVIVDMEKEVILSKDTLHNNISYCLHEGMKIKGYPIMTIARGKIIIENDGKNLTFKNHFVQPLPIYRIKQDKFVENKENHKVSWPNFEIEILEKREEFSFCKVIHTNQMLWIKNEFIYLKNKHFYCLDDYIDHFITVHENEDVKVIGLYGKFAYIIKNKEIGWIESGYLEKI